MAQRKNLTPSLQDEGKTVVPGRRYFPAWQDRDPHGWNVVRAESIADDPLYPDETEADRRTYVKYRTPNGLTSMRLDIFCETFAETD